MDNETKRTAQRHFYAYMKTIYHKDVITDQWVRENFSRTYGENEHTN